MDEEVIEGKSPKNPVCRPYAPDDLLKSLFIFFKLGYALGNVVNQELVAWILLLNKPDVLHGGAHVTLWASIQDNKTHGVPPSSKQLMRYQGLACGVNLLSSRLAQRFDC